LLYIIRAKSKMTYRVVVIVFLTADLLGYLVHSSFLGSLLSSTPTLTNVMILALIAHRWYLQRAMIGLGFQIMKKEQPATTLAGSAEAADPAYSKLKASIEAKGENSYYFAHQNTNRTQQIVRDGLPEPIVAQPGLAVSKRTAALPPVESYSFLDQGVVVRVEFDCKAFGLKSSEDLEAQIGNCVLDYSPTSVSLVLCKHEFRVTNLFDNISGASVSFRKKKLRLELVKERPNETYWTALSK